MRTSNGTLSGDVPVSESAASKVSSERTLPEDPPAIIHVDEAGSDAGNGTARSAFRTLGRVTRELRRGSILRLKAGSAFRETLSIDTAAVAVEAYGSGPPPRISGGVLVAGGRGVWTNEITSPSYLDRQTFDSEGFLGEWNSVAGAPDATRAKSGRRSWRFAPSSGDMLADRYLPGNYAEFTGWVRIDEASRAVDGQKARLVGFEGPGWYAAEGMFMWVDRAAGRFRIGIGRGTSVAAATTVAADHWVQFRLTVSCGGSPGQDRGQLYLGGADTPTHALEGLTLGSGLGRCGFGLYGYDTAAFAVNFDDLTTWLTDSVPAPTALWYIGGVEADPLIVTLDGRPGRRRHAKAAMAADGDHWWDALGRRLYLRAPVDPGRTWSAIEYSAREHPVRILASGVVLGDVVVSHHNLDDRSNGIWAGEHAATLTMARVECRHNGMDQADHVARPGRCDSPWNRRLDGRGIYAPAPPGFGSIPVVLSGWLAPPISTAIYVATETDPLVEVLYSPDVWNMVASGAWLRSSNGRRVEAEIHRRARPEFPSKPFGSRSRYVYQTAREPGWWLPDFPEFQPAPNMTRGVTRKVRCPRGVVPPPDTDGHVAVFQPDGSVFEAYCPVILSDGTIVCFCYGITDAGGDLSGREGGVCAALVPNYAGAIRDGEISDGVIPHAIAVYLPERHLAKAARWPALAWDRTNNYTGTLPMGTRLAIPFSINLDEHNLGSAAGRTIAHAAQHYGFIAIDRNGGDGLVMKTQHNASRDNGVLNARDEALARDLAWIVSRLMTVI